MKCRTGILLPAGLPRLATGRFPLGRNAAGRLAVLLLALVLLPDSFAAAEGRAGSVLYSIGGTSNALYVIDPADGSVQSAVTITLPGATVLGGNGLATHPVTGELYALLRILGQTGRQLATIDPSTGIAASIGNTGKLFSGLAFDGGATLYGITGTGAIPQGTLYTLSTIDASADSVVALGSLGGEAIAFNPDDGLLYHATGGTFRSVDLALLVVTPIATSGQPWFAAKGLTYEGSGAFLFMSDFASYLRLSSAGVADSLGQTANAKGLAFADKPVAVEGTPPRSVSSLAAWPSPYHGGLLSITFRVDAWPAPGSSAVEIAVYDAGGRALRQLSGRRVAAHAGSATWDGRDATGRPVAPGVYFLRSSADAHEKASLVVVR